MIFDFLGELGFPVLLAFYLLYRFERRVDRLENTIHGTAMHDWRRRRR